MGTITWKARQSTQEIRRGVYVDSTLKNGHQVNRYFSTSNSRRFEKYIFIYTAYILVYGFIIYKHIFTSQINFASVKY